jgi:hypothetical protein
MSQPVQPTPSPLAVATLQAEKPDDQVFTWNGMTVKITGRVPHVMFVLCSGRENAETTASVSPRAALIIVVSLTCKLGNGGSRIQRIC